MVFQSPPNDISSCGATLLYRLRGAQWRALWPVGHIGFVNCERLLLRPDGESHARFSARLRTSVGAVAVGFPPVIVFMRHVWTFGDSRGQIADVHPNYNSYTCIASRMNGKTHRRWIGCFDYIKLA